MKTTEIIRILGLLTIGVGIGFFAFQPNRLSCLNQFKLINTRIACGQHTTIRKTGYSDTKAYLEAYIRQEKASKKVGNIALYFRDLENGPVFGVNESDDFVPASLLKLPVALAFLNEAETNLTILSEKIIYQAKYNTQYDTQNINPSNRLELGRSYTIKELLEYMLKYSDNTAYDLLENYQFSNRPGNLEAIYLELGILSPQDHFDAIVDVRQYAALFRILYNVSYLNSSLSEMLLGWLSESEFDDGIVAGVPRGTVVANKFGERGMPDGTVQLHDCGIVYYPNNPYLLCVMTKGGSNFTALSDIIATISRTIYKAVDDRRIRG